MAPFFQDECGWRGNSPDSTADALGQQGHSLLISQLMQSLVTANWAGYSLSTSRLPQIILLPFLLSSVSWDVEPHPRGLLSFHSLNSSVAQPVRSRRSELGRRERSQGISSLLFPCFFASTLAVALRHPSLGLLWVLVTLLPLLLPACAGESFLPL